MTDINTRDQVMCHGDSPTLAEGCQPRLAPTIKYNESACQAMAYGSNTESPESCAGEYEAKFRMGTSQIRSEYVEEFSAEVMLWDLNPRGVLGSGVFNVLLNRASSLLGLAGSQNDRFNNADFIFDGENLLIVSVDDLTHGSYGGYDIEQIAKRAGVTITPDPAGYQYEKNGAMLNQAEAMIELSRYGFAMASVAENRIDAVVQAMRERHVTATPAAGDEPGLWSIYQFSNPPRSMRMTADGLLWLLVLPE